jgi:hypothetical protein
VPGFGLVAAASSAFAARQQQLVLGSSTGTSSDSSHVCSAPIDGTRRPVAMGDVAAVGGINVGAWSRMSRSSARTFARVSRFHVLEEPTRVTRGLGTAGA